MEKAESAVGRAEQRHSVLDGNQAEGMLGHLSFESERKKETNKQRERSSENLRCFVDLKVQ